MKAIPLSELYTEDGLIKAVNECVFCDETMILTNEKGIGESVLMSLKEYNKLLGRNSDDYEDCGLRLK